MGCINNTLTRSLDAVDRPSNQGLKEMGSPDMHLLITALGVGGEQREFLNLLWIKPPNHQNCCCQN